MMKAVPANPSKAKIIALPCQPGCSFSSIVLFATLCVALFLQLVTTALGENSRALKVAKEDSYNSICALLDARAQAYAANAAASRPLFDSEHAAQHDKEFQGNLSKIASFVILLFRTN